MIHTMENNTSIKYPWSISKKSLPKRLKLAILNFLLDFKKVQNQNVFQVFLSNFDFFKSPNIHTHKHTFLFWILVDSCVLHILVYLKRSLTKWLAILKCIKLPPVKKLIFARNHLTHFGLVRTIWFKLLNCEHRYEWAYQINLWTCTASVQILLESREMNKRVLWHNCNEH